MTPSLCSLEGFPREALCRNHRIRSHIMSLLIICSCFRLLSEDRHKDNTIQKASSQVVHRMEQFRKYVAYMLLGELSCLSHGYFQGTVLILLTA